MDANTWNTKIEDLADRMGTAEEKRADMAAPGGGRPNDMIGNLRDALHHYDLGDLSATDLARVFDGLIVAYTGHPFMLPFDTAGRGDTETHPIMGDAAQLFDAAVWSTLAD